MKKKIILFMAIAAMSLSMVGCADDNGSTTNSSNFSSPYTSEEVSIDDSYETVAVPEGGWTAEELLKTIRINGESIEVPFTIESLGEDYKINDEYTFRQEDSNDITMTLMYQGTDCMVVYMTNLEDEGIDIIQSKNVARFTTNDTAFGEASRILSVNRITVSSKKEEVIYALGEPDEISGSSFIYKDKTKDKTDEFKIIAITISNDVVTGITVYLKEK